MSEWFAVPMFCFKCDRMFDIGDGRQLCPRCGSHGHPPEVERARLEQHTVQHRTRGGVGVVGRALRGRKR